jgi:putative transposase
MRSRSRFARASGVQFTPWVAAGVNADGHREIFGIPVSTAADGAGWLGFLRDLTVRGLSGSSSSPATPHAGLVRAIAATLPGDS